MSLPRNYFWNRIPAARLLLPLVSGILLQWQLQFSFSSMLIATCICCLLLAGYFFIPQHLKFRFRVLNGLLTNCLFILAGAMLVWWHDVRNDTNWIGKDSIANNFILLKLDEPLVEKSNSYKSVATVEGVYEKDGFKKSSGRIILYFKKDSSVLLLHYGTQIVIRKRLQEIGNSGNPGGFDFKRYCLFQGITHQVYLAATDFEMTGNDEQSYFDKFIFDARSWVVHTLQRFIHGNKEQGLAEALLIGYKDDLDKSLVQSYTNTGVVHIIAISGMHLALIYGLLVLMTRPIQKRKELKWFRVLLILGFLWMFTVLAGAQASVVRSAVMFTCIIVGESLSRRSSIYNTLAVSAFLLLVYDPFWLWDVGFQLSYAAVISIVAFYRPVYNWFYFPNKLPDFFWKTIAISIAAQIFTTPVSLYHFHQFPVLFLLTNLLAVPLSSIILFGEIAVCLLSFIPSFAVLAGKATGFLIFCMNSYIEKIEGISFSLWSGFSVSIMQTMLLLLATTLICSWFLEKRKWTLWLSMICLFAMIVLRSFSFSQSYHQKKIIVYNVPKHSAMDVVYGRKSCFLGDTALLFDEFTRNFHIQPSRILYRVQEDVLLPAATREFDFFGKKIVLIDSTLTFHPMPTREKIDLLVLQKNPKLSLSALVQAFSIAQLVIDSSVPQWKARLWKKESDSLHLPCYDVSEKGAFVMNLQTLPLPTYTGETMDK